MNEDRRNEEDAAMGDGFKESGQNTPSDSEKENTENKSEYDLNAELSRGTRKQKKKKHRYSVLLLFCAIAFITVYVIVNLGSISGFVSGIAVVLTPIILGFAIAYLLNPIMKFIEKNIFRGIKHRRLLRGLSLLTTYVLAISVIAAILMVILPEFIESVTVFGSHFNEYIDETIAEINGFIADYFGTHDVPDTINKEDLLSAVATFFTESGDFFQMLGAYIIEYGKGLVIGVTNTVIGIFISIYVLASKERLSAQADKISTAFLSPKAKDTLYRYAGICNRTFGGFIIGKIIDSLIIGILTLIVLMIFDIPYELLVSVIVCVTNIIPVFGPFIGAIPSFFIIFIVDPTKAFIFLALIFLIQQLDGNVIGPKILGDKTGLSSLGVIIAIIIMGEYFGVIGMIVGVPIFSILLTIINEFVENRLRKKDLPANTAEYYPKDSLVEPYEYEDDSAFSFNVFALSGRIFGRIVKLFSRKSKKDKKDKKATKGKEEDKQ